MGLFKKKSTVDPVDVLVLKNEIAALKERLDASEQAKAQLADQMSSLAATTMVLSSNNRTDASDIVEQLEFIERRLEATESVNPKLDALARRINEVASRASAPGAPVDNSVLAARLEQVAALAAAPAQPDDELAARLIQLERTATSVESLNRQIVVLTATVSAQTNVSEQVAELAERIDDLQAAPAPQQQAPVVVAAPAPDLSPQLAELAARIDQVAKLATEPAQPDRELEGRPDTRA
jgi:chromosome segregation ATPase